MSVTTSNVSPSTPYFRGVPSWFRASCREAARGGSAGYFWAGHSLGGWVRGLVPDGIGEDDWLDIIAAELVPLLDGKDMAGVERWLATRFPKVMGLVPVRRRENFLAGFAQGEAEE